MRRSSAAPIAASAFAFLAACGASSPTSPIPTTTTTTLPPRSEIAITILPDPIIATPSGQAQFPWTVEFRVRVAESAGLPCNINQMIRTYKDRATNLEIVTGTSNPDDISRLSDGSNFLAARSSKDIGPFTLTYRGSNNGRQLIITVTVEVIDARGNRFSVTEDVQVV